MKTRRIIRVTLALVIAPISIPYRLTMNFLFLMGDVMYKLDRKINKLFDLIEG